MKRVIDSSVAFKWVVPEQDTDKALLMRDDYRNGILDLLAPNVSSADDKLVKKLQPHFPFIVALSAMP